MSGQYQLTIEDVEDQAAIPNGLSPNPTHILFSFAGPYLGPVGFAANSPLQDESVLENRTARFEVLLTGAQPWFYQWFHVGQPLADATNRTLTLPANAVTAGSYYVVVSNEFSTAVSPLANLAVIPDLLPPKLLSVRGLAAGLNQIELNFDEVLDPVSAVNLAKYSLGLVPVYSAALNDAGTGVTLRTGGLVAGQLYLPAISGVKDLAAAGNAFSGTVSFIGSMNYTGEVLADGAVRHWRLDETNGSRNLASLVSVREAISSAVASPVNNPTFRIPGLLAGEPGNTAVHFNALNQQYLAVPNGNDINSSSGPWAKKSVELWFRADSVPAPDSTGLAATAALWEQGGANRGLALYLWRDPANLSSNQASLVFHVVNNPSDGAGSPFGPPAGAPVFVHTNIEAGATYHVVAVLDGDTAGTNGDLILYVNGIEAARVAGAGQIYNHTGNVQIGHGNGRIHTGENGELGYFDGTIDEVALYNRALPPSRVAAHFQAGSTSTDVSTNALSIVRVDTRGNPNLLLVTFSKPVNAANAADLANYSLRSSGGSVLSLSGAQLLADERTVRLQGGFVFQIDENYTLSVSNITDQTPAPNASTLVGTSVPFTFAAPGPVIYDFNADVSKDFQLFGSAGLVTSGSHDGSGYLRLTDALANQNGAILFTVRRDVEEFHLRFKARLSDASSNAADGFSVNLAADLPTGTFGTAEEGYQPLTTITADRLVIAFDNFTSNSGDSSPSIALKWQGMVLTNVLTGTNDIPALHTPGGAWVDVDIALDRGHRLTVAYAGVPVISHTIASFTGVKNARLGIAARTSGSYETHWFDDIRINYAPDNIGVAGVGPASELASITALENQVVHYSIVPTGAGPFSYQWFHEGTAISGASDRVLKVVASTNVTGRYHAVVHNEFSQATSPQASLYVDTDSSPASVTGILGLAGTLNEIRVWFDEPVDPVTATNPAVYSAGPLPILGATLAANGLGVTLKTGPQTFQQAYTLQITGLTDRSAAGNVLNAVLPFVADASYPDEVVADQPVRYWRLDETNGVNVFSLTSALDVLASTPGTLVNGPLLNQPSLVPNAAGNGAIRLNSASSQRITIPSGSDINTTVGPWEKKTIEFWFKAETVPAPGTSGTAASAGLYEQGAGTRGLSIYLWRNPTNSNPVEAELVFNAWNNAANDGPGAPFGVPGSPVYVSAPVTIGIPYHVVAVLDGGTNLGTGRLILYLNGAEVAQSTGAGRLYVHNSDVQIGRGNTLLHTSVNTTAVNLPHFNGVVDEFSLYNVALSNERVAAHYQVANTVSTRPTISSFQWEGSRLVIRWAGNERLQHATNAAGPFVDVLNAASPFQVPVTASPSGFFRLVR